jgi:excisionase family DNA binding protein
MSVTSPLARAILDALQADPAACAELRTLLNIEPPAAPQQDGWLDAKRAAEYLGITTSGLYKLTAGRMIPFEQDGPGCRCWFRRTELDAWREHGGARSRADPRTARLSSD